PPKVKTSNPLRDIVLPSHGLPEGVFGPAMKRLAMLHAADDAWLADTLSDDGSSRPPILALDVCAAVDLDVPEPVLGANDDGALARQQMQHICVVVVVSSLSVSHTFFFRCLAGVDLDGGSPQLDGQVADPAQAKWQELSLAQLKSACDGKSQDH